MLSTFDMHHSLLYNVDSFAPVLQQRFREDEWLAQSHTANKFEEVGS